MTGIVKRISLAFLIGSNWLLASCDSVPEPKKLNNTDTQFLKENCALTAMDAPGQGLYMSGTGLYMSGTIGGLNISNQPEPSSDYPINAMSAVPNLESFSAHRNVGIIVADKFSTPGGDPAYSLGGDLAQLVDAAQYGQAALEATFNDLQASGQLSHGALVMAHLHALLEAAPDTSSEYSDGEGIFVYKRGYHTLALKAVDVSGVNSADMVGLIDAAQGELAQSNYLGTGGIDVYVVNMSFALVPCEVLSPKNWEGNDSLEAYLAELEAAGIDPDTYLLGEAARVDESDPLVTFLNDLPGGEGHAVASAGNYGGDAPMYPALAPDVLSVASSDLQTGAFSGFSNYGEVAAPGWLFRIRDPASGVDVPEISYAGTSFSGPLVALYAALDLAAKEPQCYDSKPAELVSDGIYDNVALADAIGARCGSSAAPAIPLPTIPIPKPSFPWS